MTSLTITLYDVLVQTLSNMISNLGYIILFIWAIRFLGKEIGKLGEKVPDWLSQYEQIKMRQRAIERAKAG